MLASVMTFDDFADKLQVATDDFDFSITGQVAYVCKQGRARIGLISQMGNGDWRIFQPWADVGQLDDLAPGDVILFSGRFDAEKRRTLCTTPPLSLSAHSVERIRHDSFPPARIVNGCEVSAGTCLRQIVTARGVLVSAMLDPTDSQLVWMTLRDRGSKFRVMTTTDSFPVDKLRQLVDAEISVTGLCDVQWDWCREIGCHLKLFGGDNLQVISPPPDDPFATDPVGYNYLQRHRCQSNGRVIGLDDNTVFLRRDNGEFLPASLVPGQPPPAVGTLVEVAGFVEPDQNNMRLVEAIVRSVDAPPAEPEKPVDVNPSEFWQASRRTGLVRTDHHGQIIHFTGVLNGLGDGQPGETTLFVQSGDISIPLGVEALRGRLDKRLCKDALIDVTGICLIEFDAGDSSSAFPKFKGIRIIPRTEDDVRILSLPSWWTPFRLFLALCTLLAALAAILVWNVSLRRLATRKGRALCRMEIGKAEAELRTGERTRLAAELHDYLTQNLTAIEYRFASSDKLRSTDPAGADELYRTARKMLTSCRTDLRRCLWDLKSEALEEKDFNVAIRKTIAPILNGTRVLIRFAVPRARFNDSSAHAILSIIRELVANAVNHGKARQIRIAGALDGQTVRISVKDDGIGFNPQDVSALAGHFGLAGIRDRVRKLHATFEIDAEPGKGTQAFVTIPLKHKSQPKQDQP